MVGNRTRVKVVKNKVAAPFSEAEFDILYNQGISREGELLDMGVDKGVVTKLGTWFSFGEERLGQGRENARAYLKEHVDTRARLDGMLRSAFAIPSAAGAVEATKPAAAEEPVAVGAGAGAANGAARPAVNGAVAERPDRPERPAPRRG